MTKSSSVFLGARAPVNTAHLCSEAHETLVLGFDTMNRCCASVKKRLSSCHIISLIRASSKEGGPNLIIFVLMSVSSFTDDFP